MQRYRRFSVDLTEENYIKLKTQSAKLGLRMKELLNLCLNKHFFEEEKKNPRKFFWDRKNK